MIRVELKNDFHNTYREFTMPEDRVLDRRTVQRIRKALCGVSGCECGGELSERGPQREHYEFLPLADGAVEVL